MANAVLPEPFHDLEPFIAWALATESERMSKRQTSEMAEIQAFYGAIFPRMPEIIAYLNDFALDAMPEAATRLMYLTLSLAEIAPAVENFGQPREADTFDPFRFVPQHK
jgi:hypothetical protein